jgi:hypothetical protein
MAGQNVASVLKRTDAGAALRAEAIPGGRPAVTVLSAP